MRDRASGRAKYALVMHPDILIVSTAPRNTRSALIASPPSGIASTADAASQLSVAEHLYEMPAFECAQAARLRAGDLLMRTMRL